jgi:tetratricopeptide (TPR) repeat protein
MPEYRAAIDDAWDLLDHDPQHAAALALGVLADFPEAIDAYVVLAAANDVRAVAIALLKEAVCVGTAAAQAERAAFDYAFDRDAYVRALNNLARLLWEADRPGNREEALRFARRALRLDWNDRAGTRLLLMAWEASAGNWAAARRITRRCRDEARTEVRYWLALHAFRDGALDADALLAKAIATNPHVVAALHGKLVSLHLPSGSYGYGSPDEAALYASDAREGWRNSPGAMEWLEAAYRDGLEKI